MTRKEIIDHLIECGFTQRTTSNFQKDCIDIKIIDNDFVRVEIYGPGNEVVMWFVADFETVQIENNVQS